MELSVVMAVYNGETYLHESIESILTQTYRDFEFIIVNDGSVDKTKTILNNITDKRVKVIHLNKNIGLGGALHLGVQNSTGTWIARHDADDISLPSRFEQQINYLRANPDTIVVGSLIENIPGNTPIPDKELRSSERHFNSFTLRQKIREERFHGCPICFGACIFSKEAYMNAGGYNPHCRLCEDYDLLLRLFEVGHIDIVPKILYQYRVESGSLSRKSWDDTSITIVRMATRYICKFCYRHIKPRFIVFGTKKGCKKFKEKIASKGKFKVLQYISRDLLEGVGAAMAQYRSGKVNGIFVLDASDSLGVIDLFKDAGMQLNQNLFRIHNIW